uniref:Transcription factor 19 n=1 Tax=Molossus molossus TaxID=27622 RepID=A0A7J8GUQ6_MOLMO|nr:transcription factor 19 [Molossus molossus]
MLPCFQLLRIGGGRGGDLYTFHPPSGTGCTYRLGCRADLCDVALRPQQEPGLISGVHAELHAERQGDDWRVSLEDHSSQGGNDYRAGSTAMNSRSETGPHGQGDRRDGFLPWIILPSGSC